MELISLTLVLLFVIPLAPANPQICLIMPVVVWAQVGKEFPDMRQNERKMKFIRVRDAVRTVDQLKGEPMLNGGP